ncbi:MAG: hypothetical protein IKW74_05850 [Thermoguttaceae bacterium]|nr:hypothetical protein [Thermoguttaceae bacterium]
MKKRRFYQHRRPATGNIAENGQDSFLDVLSNIVGILVILVMVAGSRVRGIPLEADQNIREEQQVVSELEPEGYPSHDEREQYLRTAADYERIKQEIATLQQKVNEKNRQMALVSQQADGAEQEYNNLIQGMNCLEAAVEIESRKTGESEKKLFDLQSELLRGQEEMKKLEERREALMAAQSKATVLENIPTPLSKPVDENHEAFFCLRGGRISHIPVNVFMERLRGFFKNYQPYKSTVIDERIGPVDGYNFHFNVNVNETRNTQGVHISFVFNMGECIPLREDWGETTEVALRTDSEFQRKLALYLKDISVITLFVYPDSFNDLREIKKYLLEQGYTIALRPMPAGMNVTFSPNGTSTTSY